MNILPADRKWKLGALMAAAVVMAAAVAVAAALLSSGPGKQVQTYDFLIGSAFVEGRQQLPEDLNAVIVKANPGVAKIDSSLMRRIRSEHRGALLINYEQAFALNDEEAADARRKGFLSHTCAGQEIHPQNIPSVTLLDGTDPVAVRWRARTIADESVVNRADGTYLDTLRPYFNTGFYDGAPCHLSQRGWLKGSISLVDKVTRKTGGKPVIVNGSGLQSGKGYFTHQAAADELIAHSWGVQIEQFLRNEKNARLDVRYMNHLVSMGKRVFAKCKNADGVCRSYIEKSRRPHLTYVRLGEG